MKKTRLKMLSGIARLDLCLSFWTGLGVFYSKTPRFGPADRNLANTSKAGQSQDHGLDREAHYEGKSR